jgi:3-phenylpropionate/cinnamic acid dioxygenase small subunit
MALSLQEISDRIEINDLLIRYTKAIDQKDWKLLDTVFMPDAELDYVSSGGIEGRYPEVRAWLEKALAIFPVTVHYVTNSEVTLQGDRASARTAVYNPMFFKNPDGTLHHFAVGAYYVDELVRTKQGWRVAKRREDQAFLEGSLPKALTIPT